MTHYNEENTIPFIESIHGYQWLLADLDTLLDIVDVQLLLSFSGTGVFTKRQLLIINECKNKEVQQSGCSSKHHCPLNN